MLLREAPWRDRTSLPARLLWWQAFTLYVNLIVFLHYRLRYTESGYRAATRDVLWDILRAAKGIAVAWEKWLLATHVRPEAVQPATPFEASPLRNHQSAEIAQAPSGGTHRE